MISILYSFLFAASITLINPWGPILFLSETGRGETWTLPKVLAIVVITTLNLILLVKKKMEEKNLKLCITLNDKVWLGLWLAFLLSATVSTLLSPFSLYSLLGHPVLGDGLLYWILVFTFTVSNAFIIRLEPRIFHAQLRGILAGGSVVGVSIIPQLLDWRIDYTILSGQVSFFDEQLLESSIWKDQMPIGLFSNRGHASFVLASSICLGFAAIASQWLVSRFWKMACLLMFFSLLGTQTLAGILSCIIGTIYLFFQHFPSIVEQALSRRLQRKRVLYFMAVVSALVLLVFFSLNYREYSAMSREKSMYAFLESIVTGRLYLWSLALKGVAQRPIFGWGLDGFGIAHLFVGDWNERLNSHIPDGTYVTQILNIYEYTFDFLSTDNNVYSGLAFSQKAHTLFLDLTLSIGILGASLYLGLTGYSFWRLSKSKFKLLCVVVLVYLVFTQAWFESAQYTHISWWCLSLGFSTKR